MDWKVHGSSLEAARSLENWIAREFILRFSTLRTLALRCTDCEVDEKDLQ